MNESESDLLENMNGQRCESIATLLKSARLRVRTNLRAGSDPAPYQGKRSTGGYVPT